MKTKKNNPLSPDKDEKRPPVGKKAHKNGVGESKTLTWTTEQRKVADLVPFTLNPRQMSESQVEALSESLRRFGLVEIPVVNKDNVIIAGHQRLKIMQILGRGDELVDVRVPNRQLTEKEYQEYLVRSNKNTADWDYNILGNVFDPKDLVAWGFTPIQLGMDSLDDIPEGATSVITFTFKKKISEELRELIKEKMTEYEVSSREELFLKLIDPEGQFYESSNDE